MTSSASIDDLLRHDEEPAGPVRRRGALRRWLPAVFGAAALAAAVVLGLRMVGVGVSAPAVFAGFLALILLRRVTARLAPPPPVRIRLPGGTRDSDEADYNWAARDALGSAVNRWETKLAWSQGEPERFARGVLPMLGDLADERLRQRHGITRASDPARARKLLGEPLWALLAAPPKRTPAPRDLAALVAPLEKL
ncbi:hypothetical protein [Plantactinospora sp. CA-290183]|uniref:hypothetical protein n=1 Tax=Plantactinospora sp. CA-290183 TaxID=3240006 RepID=UPI003D9059BF